MRTAADVAQAGPGGQGVGQMEIGRVLVTAEDGGHAALGPAGGGLGELRFCQDPHPHARHLGQPDHGRQAGHARTENKNVELHRGSRPRRAAGGQPVTARSSSASSRPVVASTVSPMSTGVLVVSTCTMVGAKSVEFGLVVVGVGDDDDLVAAMDETGGRPIETDLTRAADDGIGLETGPVVDVDHGHLLVLEDIGERHELGIEAYGPDVVEVGVGDRRPVDLGLHHAPAHNRSALPSRRNTGLFVRLAAARLHGVHDTPTTVADAGASRSSTSTTTPTLSISRTGPTVAATSRRTSPERKSGARRVAASTATA